MTMTDQVSYTLEQKLIVIEQGEDEVSDLPFVEGNDQTVTDLPKVESAPKDHHRRYDV